MRRQASLRAFADTGNTRSTFLDCRFSSLIALVVSGITLAWPFLDCGIAKERRSEIDVLPSHCQDLAPPHCCLQREQNDGPDQVISRSLARGKQLVELALSKPPVSPLVNCVKGQIR